jgi:lysophospholipase L1-like esterase
MLATNAKAQRVQPLEWMTATRWAFLATLLLCGAPMAVAQPSPEPSTRPRMSATEPPVNPALPTLWIIGDSTVKNGQDTGNNGQWGWGNPIHALFDQSKINVQNWALGGTSSRTFQVGRQWSHVIDAMKPGDFLMMQFGHNDSSKPDEPTRARGTLPGNGEETVEIDNPITKKHEVVHTYGWYLRNYVTLAKAKGVAGVFFCSPIPRNSWKNGVVDHNASYTKWAKEAADMAGVSFIDLNAHIARHYEEKGEKFVTDTYFPDAEHTHTDWAGAILNAQCVVEGIKELDHSPLARYLLADPPAEIKLPMGKAR